MLNLRQAITTALAAAGGAFLLCALKRSENLERLKRRRAARARRGRHGPSSWARAVARAVHSGELEALFLAEERLWARVSDDVRRSPSFVLGHNSAGAACAAPAADALAPPPAVRPLRTVSFAGGGFRTLSYVGQLMYLERHGLIDKRTRFYGASFGAFFAASCALTTGPGTRAAPSRSLADRETTVAAACDVVRAVHDDYVGTWGVYGELFEHLADAHLPDEISAAQGRLHVAVTRFGLPRALGGRGLVRAELISEFRDKRDLVDALTASQYVPGLTCGPWLLRWFRGGFCCDGGLLDNTPLPPPPAEDDGDAPSADEAALGGALDDADDGADEADDDSSDGPRAGSAASLPEARRRRRAPGSIAAAQRRMRCFLNPEHYEPPVLDARARHFTCRDPFAPVLQVLSPPRCPLGRVEERVVEEIRRGYRAAHAALERAQPGAEHAAERGAESKSTRRRSRDRARRRKDAQQRGVMILPGAARSA